MTAIYSEPFPEDRRELEKIDCNKLPDIRVTGKNTTFWQAVHPRLPLYLSVLFVPPTTLFAAGVLILRYQRRRPPPPEPTRTWW